MIELDHDGDIINLKKDRFGYRVIHPVMNPDGSRNWLNTLVGGWGNLFKLLFVLFIIFCFLFGTKEIMTDCNDFAANPCRYTNLDCSSPLPYLPNRLGGVFNEAPTRNKY